MTAWFRCGCPRCTAHDPETCPCPECQPGPGIDYGAVQDRLTASRRTRMNALLRVPYEDLRPGERRELDDLLAIYLHTTA